MKSVQPIKKVLVDSFIDDWKNSFGDANRVQQLQNDKLSLQWYAGGKLDNLAEVLQRLLGTDDVKCGAIEKTRIRVIFELALQGFSCVALNKLVDIANEVNAGGRLKYPNILSDFYSTVLGPNRLQNTNINFLLQNNYASVLVDLYVKDPDLFKKVANNQLDAILLKPLGELYRASPQLYRICEFRIDALRNSFILLNPMGNNSILSLLSSNFARQNPDDRDVKTFNAIKNIFDPNAPDAVLGNIGSYASAVAYLTSLDNKDIYNPKFQAVVNAMIDNMVGEARQIKTDATMASFVASANAKSSKVRGVIPSGMDSGIMNITAGLLGARSASAVVNTDNRGVAIKNVVVDSLCRIFQMVMQEPLDRKIIDLLHVMRGPEGVAPVTKDIRSAAMVALKDLGVGKSDLHRGLVSKVLFNELKSKQPKIL